MTDSNQGDHWAFLASEIGAKPSKIVDQEPPHIEEVRPAVKPPVVETKAKVLPHAPTRTSTNWDLLAGELGIEVPPPPFDAHVGPPETKKAAPARFEPAAALDINDFSFKKEEQEIAKRFAQIPLEPKARDDSEGDEGDSAESPRSKFESGSQKDQDKKSRRRPRRRRKTREPESSEEDRVRGDGIDSRYDSYDVDRDEDQTDVDQVSDESVSSRDESFAEGEEEEQASKRRRSRRGPRRRKKKPEEEQVDGEANDDRPSRVSGSASVSDREPRESTPRESTSRESTSRESTSRESTSRESTSRESTSRESTSRESTSRPRPQRSQPSPASSLDVDSESDMNAVTKAIPTWDEAIGVIIAKNMENRKRHGSSQSHGRSSSSSRDRRRRS